jgi:hypothetical protein
MGAGLAELHEIASRTELIELVAIQVRTVPDDGAERAAWERAHHKPGAPPLARVVNGRLGSTLTSAAVRTEAFVTVVVGEDRIAKSAKESGGGVDGRARVLYGALSGRESAARRGRAPTVTRAGLPALASRSVPGSPGDRAALVAAELAARDNPAIATVPMAPPALQRPYRDPAPPPRRSGPASPTLSSCPTEARSSAHSPRALRTGRAPRRSPSAMSQTGADRLVGREEMSAITGDEPGRTGRLTRAKQRRATAQVTG